MSSTSQQRTAKLRVQDPVLTELAHGYENNELVGETLLPVVELEKEGGKVPTFGRLAFRLSSTARELRGASNRLTPDDIGSIDVVMDEHDIEYPIDYREDNEASFPLRQHAQTTTQDIIALGREKEIASLVLNDANYEATNKVVLSGTSQFTDPNSDPIAVIKKGKRAIKRTTGRKANVCVIAGDVWEVISEHPKVLEKIKYVQAGVIEPEDFAKLIKVDTVKIGEAVYEESGQLKDIWSDVIVLAYVPKKDAKSGNKHNVYKPSFGYTPRRKNGLFVDRYHENGGKIEIVRTTDIYKPLIVGKSAGYLIKDCLA